MPLNVLHLGPYPPPEGGITRNMLAICDALRGRGDRFSIIATSQSSCASDEPNIYQPRSPFELLSLMRSVNYDVAHLHIGGDVTTRVVLLALAVGTFGGRKTILTMHSGGYTTDKLGKGWLARFAFRRFAKVIAVNDDLANVFRGVGVKDERICVIPPYALAEPDPTVDVPDELSEFFEKHSPVLLSVGGLEAEYEPLLQIEAMGVIRAKYPNAGLVILGDGSMRGEVETAGARSKESIMLAGNVAHTVTLHLMQRADVVLRITKFDGDSISVREALFLGTPVIATDRGTRPEGVHVINDTTVTAIATAVHAIVAGKKSVLRSEDDGKQNIRQVLELYDGLAGTVEHDIKTVANESVRADVR